MRVKHTYRLPQNARRDNDWYLNEAPGLPGSNEKSNKENGTLTACPALNANAPPAHDNFLLQYHSFWRRLQIVLAKERCQDARRNDGILVESLEAFPRPELYGPDRRRQRTRPRPQSVHTQVDHTQDHTLPPAHFNPACFVVVFCPIVSCSGREATGPSRAAPAEARKCRMDVSVVSIGLCRCCCTRFHSLMLYEIEFVSTYTFTQARVSSYDQRSRSPGT